MMKYPESLRKNSFTELAPGFRSDLFDPKLKNYRDPDPDSLSTSPSGLLATAIGLIYLFIVGRYVYMFSLAILTDGVFDVTSGFGVMVVTLAMVISYWLLGHRSVERLEMV